MFYRIRELFLGLNTLFGQRFKGHVHNVVLLACRYLCVLYFY